MCSREKELTSDLAHSETVNKRLHDQLNAATQTINEQRSKSDLYDHLNTQKQSLAASVDDYRSREQRLAGQLKSVQDERDVLNRRAADAEQKVLLLREQNVFLQKEKEILTDRMCSLHSPFSIL